MDEPSPEFMAATYVAAEIGDEPQHVAVAEETVTAHLERQSFDVDRTVATVQKVEDGIKIEYEGQTVTLTFD